MLDSYKEIALCRDFAAEAHSNQKRKYTNEMYIVHPEAVAAKVRGVINDDRAVMAALLHDVIEDTWISSWQIGSKFGKEVEKLVLEVTDISTLKDGNRSKRKEIDRNHIAKASYLGKTIKLADLIDNTSTIVKYDEEFARVYMKEKRLLLEVLRDGNLYLWKEAHDMVNEYYRNN